MAPAPIWGSRTLKDDRLAEFQAGLHKKSRIWREIDAFRSVCQRTNRIVTGKADLAVTISDENVPAPSWTDGQSVFLSEAEIWADLERENFDMADFVLRWNGANYHEVAHIILSPRFNDPMIVWLNKKVKQSQDLRWWYAYNALEDQRIEAIYTGLYPSTTGYFRAMALEFLLHDTSALPRVFPLIHGRRFLSSGTRRKVRQAFVQLYGDKLADDFSAVIDQYMQLVLPRDDVRGRKLIELYYDLITSTQFGQHLPDQPCGDNGAGKQAPNPHRGNTIKQGEPRLGEQKRGAKKVVDQIDNDDIDDAESEDDGEGEEQDSGTQGTQGKGNNSKGKSDEKGKGDSDSDEKVEGAYDGGSTPVKDHQRPENDGPQGEGKTEHHAPDPTISAEDLLDAVKEARDQAKAEMADVKADPNLAQDVQDTCRSIRSASQSSGNVVTTSYGKHRNETPAPEVVAASRRVTQILEHVRLDLEPSWLHGLPTGRLNIGQGIARRVDPSIIDIFDQWDEGAEEESGVEAVIVIDLSGSMMGQIVGASRALWALKRAFDDVQIRTTVIGFSDTHMILFDPNHKANKGQTPLFDVLGGTCPDGALKEAYNILNRSQEPNRLLIAITDGAWQGNRDEQDNIIAALRRDGVVTMLLAIGHTTITYGGDHGMEVVSVIEKMEDIFVSVQAVVLALMKKVQLH